MGRKSKAKKLLREQTEAVEAEKELKKGKNKQKKPEDEKPRFRINRKKLFGGILAVIMLGILISVGYLIFEKAFRAEPIAKFLPAESTIAFLEINTNFEHNQLNKTFNLLKSHPEYSKEKLISQTEKFFSINYENDVKSWLGRAAGVAFINSAKEQNVVHEIYFAEVISKTNVEKFLEKYKPDENIYIGKKTYSIKLPGGQQYITFLNNYLFSSPSEQAIFQLVDGQNSSIEKLYSTKKYRKVDNNLPLNRTAFAFLNFDQLSDGFLQKFPAISQSGLSIEILKPLIKAFDSEGAALIAMDDNFAIQTFLTLDSKSDNNDYLSFEKKYDAHLASYLSKDTLALWGAKNLEGQLGKIISSFTGSDESSRMIADQILQNYTEKYFGQDTSFKSDILPLFKNEFVFAVEKINEANVYKLILELESAQTDEVNIHQLANNFATYGGIFEPKVVEHTLPDGTVGKEIVAVPEEIIKNQSIYHDNTIYELKMGKQNWGIYYAVTDKVAIVTNNIDAVKTSIDLEKDQANGLSTTPLFTTNIQPVIKGSDEISYFNFEYILPIIFDKKPIPPLLNIVSSFSSGKNYFNDGVVTINYLHIK